MTLLNLKRQIKLLEVKINVDAKPQETFKSFREISKTLNIPIRMWLRLLEPH